MPVAYAKAAFATGGILPSGNIGRGVPARFVGVLPVT